MSATVKRSVRASLVAAAGEPRPLRVALRYDAHDPLAVHLHFPAQACLDGTETVWTFARDLLEEGVHAPVGEGDVRLRPDGPGRTVLALHADEGVALVLLDTDGLKGFLTAARRRGLRGGKAGTEALDRGLAELLRGA
ncbi:SsgA family sporulation/cell division regulator [Streptomyces sp. TR02-1]|uniref:SsgA family sporulation/cell division regulator n=1 Tax=Streptomyces sp. TR02-1 TaxID=3385977 RepID=UPI0039A09A1D